MAKQGGSLCNYSYSKEVPLTVLPTAREWICFSKEVYRLSLI